MTGRGEQRSRAARVLRYWRAVELFNAQQVPKTDRRRWIFDLPRDAQAPWLEPPKAKPRQYIVYGGLYELGKVTEQLDAVFPDDRHHELVGGRGALFALVIDDAGNLVEDSATLSACAWATGRTVSPGPRNKDWLDGFDDEERRFADALNRLASLKETGLSADQETSSVSSRLKDAGAAGVTKAAGAAAAAGTAAVTTPFGPVVVGVASAAAAAFVEQVLTRRTQQVDGSAHGKSQGTGERDRTQFGITSADLHDFATTLAKTLGVASVLKPAGIRVHRVTLDERAADRTDQSVIVNSRITPDLARVAAAVSEGSAGPGLRSYLSEDGLAEDQRLDVRRRSAEVLARLDPAHLPAGRWPTDTDKPLVTSQQFAVNQILADLGDSAGIFAVNGPPGTGKTTLLRDVIAAVVVDRATRLATFDRPANAFGDKIETVPIGNIFSSVRAVDEKLTGSELVVATATNKAAENVTAELPGIGAVGAWDAEATAVDYFTELATHLLTNAEAPIPAWGLVSAPLGNRANCAAFVSRVWWGNGADVTGMQDVLQEAPAPGDWPDAIRRFRSAAADVERLREERQAVAEEIRRHAQADVRRREADTAVRAASAGIDEQERAIAAARGRLDSATATFERARRDHDDHLAHKPGFWVTLSTFFRAAREWHTEHRELGKVRDERAAELDRVQSELAVYEEEVRRLAADRDRHRYALAAAEDDVRLARAVIDPAVRRWPGHVPFGSLVAEDVQLLAPWADEELSQARTRLFLEALRLHKAFVRAAGQRLKSNLTALMAHLRGETILPENCRQAAWQSLFLAVPVVSTTFASVGNLFEGLGQEALGWLLVDEAGQAAPQQAVGGIWRARRTVVVGDPLQLEPIVPLPLTAQHALRRAEGVGEQWLPEGNSVQHLADRVASYGTSLTSGHDGEDRWVGAPLLVHRRSDQPVFDISNKIAYGGMMIYGTPRRDEFPDTNAWIDVPTRRSNGNWVPDEGERLAELLAKLEALGVHAGAVFVITPFRDSMYGIRRTLAGTGVHCDEQVGTVHTFQGKETDVVVLVLGSDPRRPGARRWAAERPNLLNVAVSRARRRLYVIGDRASWREEPHFGQLASLLDDR